MGILGLLKIRVRRGINLVIRDAVARNSDPYIVVECGAQKVKTEIVEDNCNPVWNEELTIYIKDPNIPITMYVYDKDTFTRDDNMGNAQIDIKPYVECLKKEFKEFDKGEIPELECLKKESQEREIPDGTLVERVQPSTDNCLAGESCIAWNNGKLTQDMILRLRGVESGEIDVQIEWLNVPGNLSI